MVPVAVTLSDLIEKGGAYVGIAAFFGLSNRLANVTSMRPNDEFYTLGRG